MTTAVEPPAPPAPPVRRRTAGRLLSACEWAYAAGVAAAVVAVRVGGDRWGWATFVAYGPRVAALVPGGLVLLLGLVPLVRRGRVPWVTIVASLVAAVGVVGFNVPWRAPAGPSSLTVRLLTLNANGQGTDGKPYDPRHLADLVRRLSPDVLVLEEFPTENAPPPPAVGVWADVGRSWDVVVASRYPIRRTATWFARDTGGEGTALACELLTPGGPTWCVGLHLETPRRGFEPVLERQPGAAGLLAQSLARRRRLSAACADLVRRVAGPGGDVLVAGDFNEVPDGAIFRDTFGAWDDAFQRAGWGFGWTKYQLGWGVRIDHVLASPRWHARAATPCEDVGSDHVPLFAVLDRSP